MKTAALIFAFLLFASSQALACSCRRGPNMPQPDVIVQAQVTDVMPANGRIVARLRVLRVERGKVARNIEVWTAPHSAACGVTFRRGEVRRLALSPKTDGAQTRGHGNFTANSCQQLALER